MTQPLPRAVLASAALAMVTVTSCSSPARDPADPPRQEMPADSTPAPDATQGVDPGLEDFYTQTLEWDDCDEQYQCSTLRVPLDYDDPGGDEIEVALLRVPATTDDRIGSLVVNPGGPGASGLDYARNAHLVASESVRERFDVVGFDPRGVGSSTPIDCVDDAQLDEFTSGQATVDNEADLAELEETAEDFAAACEARSGDLLPHIGTADVARDLDVLRAVLGDQKLNYLGKSYGSFLGAVYADLFPDRTGRLVLDGAIDPALESMQVTLGQARGFEQALNAFLQWCVDDNCPIGGSEDQARQSLDDLLSEIDEEPLPAESGNRPLTASLAFYGIVLPLYLSADQGYPVLKEALDAAVNEGDGSDLLELADLYLNRNDDGSYQGNQNEAIIAVNCLDRADEATVAEMEASVSEFQEASPIFGEFMAWGDLACVDWPVESDYDRARISASGTEEILVVGTTGDPATPYEWAQALAEQLDSGVLLTYEAFVHTAYLSGSDCIDTAVDGYLIRGDVPDEGLVCSS